MNLKDKTVLVTGGTGSFGKFFVKKLLKNYPTINKVVVFSRDELKQHEMSIEIDHKFKEKIRFFLGDIRDLQRLKRAFEGVDIVVHAAALKQVPAAEYNPFEFIKTNVVGTQNIVDACLDLGIQKMVALSTDKASSPVNLYGASKLCADKLVIAGNNIKGERNISFSVVRYGNVLASRGSVLPLFREQLKSGSLTITSEDMTRFNITLEEGTDLVLMAIKESLGGEIFVPKIPSYNILEMAKAISPKAKLKFIGVRPGEKIHEEMISSSDSSNTLELNNYFVIIPKEFEEIRKLYIENHKAKKVAEGFSYTSDNNSHFLSAKELKELITLYE